VVSVVEAVDQLVSYPAPRIPLYPVVSAGTFTGRSKAARPSILDARWVLPVTYGRMAIALALRDMGIRPGESVLIPAYHCLSMVDPVLWAGAKAVFYRVREDASVDLEDIRRRIDRTTRVLMVPHFFGFPQEMTGIRALCDTAGLVLLEDCAHVIFGEHRGIPLGSFGDYTIASPMKFFPIHDGGILASHRRALDRISLRPLGWTFSVRAAVILLERSLQYRRFGLFRYVLAAPFWVKETLLRLVKALRPGRCDTWWGPAVGERSSGQTGDFEPKWMDLRMSQTSRTILRLASKSRVAEERRRNYRILLEGLAGLPGSRPLFSTLPDGVVPFAFPLLVDEPTRIFHALKSQGVPIMRFGEFLSEEIDASTYPESIELSRRVFQFPCHQEMRPRELDWLVATVRRELFAAASTPENGG
jgi:perosamine synthetase